MGRPRPDDVEDPRSRYPRPRDEEYDDEGAVFEEEYQHPKPSSKKIRPGRMEVPDDDDEPDDPRFMQVARVPKNGKSQGHSKALTKRSKKHESSGDEEESDESSTDSEEERRKKKKAKSKAKKLQNATVKQKLWETVAKDEIDWDFVNFVVDSLGHHENKVLKGVEDGLLLANTQTGEYNIEQYFDRGTFSKEDKKIWKKAVEKKKGSAFLICSAYKPEGGGGRGGAQPMAADPYRLHAPPPVTSFHRHYNHRCIDCRVFGVACAYHA
ncbi:MAG: hypothetical protein Q9220_002533 [cf. Caloplaca sp. 1 TL-2023]